MFQYYCLNPISKVGLDNFNENYAKTDDINEAEGVLVRSASMHEMELPEKMLCVARAGAGVNNIPLDKCAEKGIVVFNTPGANANGVKELVIAGMLLAARDVVGGIEWVKENAADENIAKTAEKENKKQVDGQLDMYNFKLAEIAHQLDKVNINELTPIDALNTLVKIKEELK